MSNDYIKMIETRARQELESLNLEQQQQIFEAYYQAGRELARGYRNAGDGTATKALYASYTKKIAEETEQIIRDYSIRGAELPLNVERLLMRESFLRAGLDTSLIDDTFHNIVGKLGMESVKNVIGGGIYKDGAGLSPRIWSASARASNQIQDVIAAGLAQDMGAAKLSKLLQDFVKPTARKTWSNDKIRDVLGDGYAAWNKNLEYNALRLARTTLAHTATMSMRQAQKVNPYAKKIRWHSVHAAGRTCSICEEMDGQVFDTEECPFDHPNGMCYQTHELEKSLNEIADELAEWCNGAENDMLDQWWETYYGEPPSTGIKNSFLHRLITRSELKQMAQDHPCNKKISFTEVSDLFKSGKIDVSQADVMLNAHDSIYGGYVGTSNSWRLNSYLRNLPDGAEITSYADTIKALDFATSLYEFEQDVKLRRFVDENYLMGTFGGDKVDDIGLHIGSVFRNKQFMSTTIDSNPCFDDRPAIMTILCDKGTKAFPTTNYFEGEIILGRDNSYELIDVVDHRNNPMSLEYEERGKTRNFNYDGIELVVKIIQK